MSNGFDFTLQMRALCQDMVRRTPSLAHIDLSRVAIGFAQTRNNSAYGMQASLTPMRFEGGSMTTQRSNRTYSVQRLFDKRGTEYLYILTFYLPRFLNHTLKEKISTVVHELWHISPAFDGDLRRFSGRCYAHSASQAEYDRQVDEVAGEWWSLNPPREVYSFLNYSFDELKKRYGAIYGTKIATPKLIPMKKPA